jgi:hypothetical protein
MLGARIECSGLSQPKMVTGEYHPGTFRVPGTGGGSSGAVPL